MNWFNQLNPDDKPVVLVLLITGAVFAVFAVCTAVVEVVKHLYPNGVAP